MLTILLDSVCVVIMAAWLLWLAAIAVSGFATAAEMLRRLRNLFKAGFDSRKRSGPRKGAQPVFGKSRTFLV